jgi:predicted transcriptional regulator
MGSFKSSELTFRGRKALRVTKTLSKGISFRIMKVLKRRSLDVSTLSVRLNVSQPYVSQCVSDLQRLGLIKVSYKPGKKGTRKICEGKISKITIEI